MIDIVLVAILFYQLYKLLRGSLAFTILIGLLLVYLTTKIVEVLNMTMLSAVLGEFVGTGFILLAIVFQKEIRRFLFYIGRSSGIGEESILHRLLKKDNTDRSEWKPLINDLARVINQMSATSTGSLMVFVNESEQSFFLDNGTELNANISGKLIETIFNKTTPLHDGAMVIRNNKIIAAGCVLPVTENQDIKGSLGMRHRAALGISEEIDAHVLVVSEETGAISYAHKGDLSYNISSAKLMDYLKIIYEIKKVDKAKVLIQANNNERNEQKKTSPPKAQDGKKAAKKQPSNNKTTEIK